MLGDVPLWTTVLQFLAAGLVGGFCVLQWVWWRGALRSDGSTWALALSVAMAALVLVAGLHGVVTRPDLHDALAFLHGQLVGAVAVLCLPAVRALGGAGPRLRPWVAVAVAALLLRAALWPVTVGDARVLGLPVGRGLAVGLLLAVVALAVTYLAVALGRADLTPLGWLLVGAGTVSLATLAAGMLLPGEPVGALLASLWPLPLAVGLESLAAVRLRRAQLMDRRRAAMRDALSSVTNTAWYHRDPAALLVRARDAAREVLGDPSIDGTLRPLQRDRFVVDLFPEEPDRLAPHERTFLIDLGLVVSTAAERYALTDRLSRAAVTDPLTALPNRRAVDTHLLEVLERAAVERTRVSVVYCDIDGFKDVNDREGHGAGDDLLRATAQYLRTWVDADTFVARLAGDEFAVVVSRAGSDDTLADLARRLRTGFGTAVGRASGPRLTCGVATWTPSEVVDADALLRHADAAMLEAKRTASGHRVFDPEMRARAEDSRRVRAALERAVAEDRITAYFQPIVDTRTLEVVGLEALARWHEGDSFVLPEHWLGLAEQTGLIVPVGRSMIRQARRALDRHHMPVAVNLSARELHEPDVLERIDEAWSGGPWEHLTIEITETTMLRTSSAVPVLSELRARGVRIALDDFGTGFSSLSRLARLPVDVLKIDRSFVREIRTPRGAGPVRAIVALAEHHGLDIVAEGVESAGDLQVLVELGVPQAQGNFVGRPAPGLPVRGARPRPSGAVPVSEELRRAEPRLPERRSRIVPRPLRVVHGTLDDATPEHL
ncbi:putative bifunctional diguanylate cyclase/phosphodiesterase [Cellulomonas wangsupingiae]|uniref:EAL domain-containing protein n=1 Tax=Cellulomonas wangsupingiae TaxID=2968085 RepID=A0ABY5K4N5_9CELL|nr:EAL domain-containing protein [Cellulomonas wangsupingiae]MCC2333218.1 EAL domain-containing protein [Cellulomonas wangsupingiae]MCM0638071.1 EAL domain-containing protein [Cellulomonas wangsupingiae]UUI63428.1 EAL domain-containing protein [Cellulomonas wangsupingiae]